MERAIKINTFRSPETYSRLLKKDVINVKVVDTIFTCLRYRDESTALHSLYMGQCAYSLATAFDPDNAPLYFYGGLTHDCGKLSMRDQILKGQRKLGLHERDEIKEHVRSGVTMLNELGMPDIVSQMALFHHESYDGSGYLFGLTGAEIPLAGRIAAVADVYSAVITNRPYSAARSHERALEIMREDRHKFDPEILDEFFKQAPKLKLYETW